VKKGLVDPISTAATTFGLICKLQAMTKKRGLNSAMEMPEIQMFHIAQDTSDRSKHMTTQSFPPAETFVTVCLAIQKKFPNLPVFTDLSLIDFIHLFGACSNNAFGSGVTNGASSSELYLMTTFMNNDCTKPSADYDLDVYFKDYRFIVVKSNRAMKAGEEVTVSYSHNPIDYDRKFILRNTYGFDCQCNTCKHIKLPESLVM
jgi:hypothetical protein